MSKTHPYVSTLTRRETILFLFFFFSTTLPLPPPPPLFLSLPLAYPGLGKLRRTRWAARAVEAGLAWAQVRSSASQTSGGGRGGGAALRGDVEAARPHVAIVSHRGRGGRTAQRRHWAVEPVEPQRRRGRQRRGRQGRGRGRRVVRLALLLLLLMRRRRRRRRETSRREGRGRR